MVNFYIYMNVGMNIMKYHETLFVYLYGFSPVCILRWFHNVECLANDLSHTSQTYGRSPECILS